MSVVSVKVSDKTKKQMEESKDKVEWPSEIRAFHSTYFVLALALDVL